jgi:hypothetical protein
VIFRLEWEKVKRIGLAEDGDNLWNIVDPIMNILVPQIGGGGE